MCEITNKPNVVHVVIIDDLSDFIVQSHVQGVYESWTHAAYVVNELNNEFAMDDYCEHHAYYMPMEVIKGSLT